jgi:hypothetical protein
MKQEPETEPGPSMRIPRFLVGRDRRGNWVVQDQTGLRGGLFVSQADALRFVRAESGNRPQAFVLTNDALELEMAPSTSDRRVEFDSLERRRVA